MPSLGSLSDGSSLNLTSSMLKGSYVSKSRAPARSVNSGTGQARTPAAPRVASRTDASGADDSISLVSVIDACPSHSTTGMERSKHPRLSQTTLITMQAGGEVEKNPRFVADLVGSKVGDIVVVCTSQFNNGDGTFQPAKKKGYR